MSTWTQHPRRVDALVAKTRIVRFCDLVAGDLYRVLRRPGNFVLVGDLVDLEADETTEDADTAILF